jgi:hypothetical protein
MATQHEIGLMLKQEAQICRNSQRCENIWSPCSWFKSKKSAISGEPVKKIILYVILNMCDRYFGI